MKEENKPYSKEPEISVGIMKGQEIRFTLNIPYRLEHHTYSFQGMGKARMIGREIHLDIGNYHTITKEPIRFIPSNYQEGSFSLEDVTIGINFHWEKKEQQTFQGILCLQALQDGIQVVNTLKLEDYLTSVIASEMKATSQLSFLKTHAIISRSWLLAQLDQKKIRQKSGPVSESKNTPSKNSQEWIQWYDREDHDTFDVCADDHCQRYQGRHRLNNPTVEKAIQETKGQVLLDHQRSVCDARFSKCCGGVSEPFENVWQNQPVSYLKSVSDLSLSATPPVLSSEEAFSKWITDPPKAFCQVTDKELLAQILNDFDIQTTNFYRWQIDYSQEEIEHIIREKSGINFGQIIDLVPLERGPSGRLIKLLVKGTQKTLTIGKELEIRRLLSTSHLYSSAFLVEKKMGTSPIPERFILKGAGWGHGVGLCQIGAAALCKEGHSPETVLSHYFPNTTLKKLY